MLFLHTADWHVGKTLKGRDRLEEQRAVLGQIADLAEDHQVDAGLVAGGVYHLSAPSAPAQQIVVRTLLRLAQTGAQVIVIAGNHDHGPTFEAYRPLMGVAGITLAGMYRPAGRGGVIRFAPRSAGAGTFGGGERSAQSIFEYSVPAAIFPVEAHYVALGHLHRRQTLAAPAPVHYSGAPLAVDFGEQDNANVVCLVEATPGTPARVTDLPVTAGRRLRTVHGTLAELEASADFYGQDYLRVYLREATRAGLRDDTMAILPNALEVRI